MPDIVIFGFVQFATLLLLLAYCGNSSGLIYIVLTISVHNGMAFALKPLSPPLTNNLRI